MEDFFRRVDFVSEIPNTQLQPETCLTREIGLKYYTRLSSGDIYYHYTDYDGYIDRITVAPGVRQRRNIQNAVIHGVETGWRYVISDIGCLLKYNNNPPIVRGLPHPWARPVVKEYNTCARRCTLEYYASPSPDHRPLHDPDAAPITPAHVLPLRSAGAARSQLWC